MPVQEWFAGPDILGVRSEAEKKLRFFSGFSLVDQNSFVKN